MNAVVVQIKPTADAFYPSNYYPWSEYITGTQGKDPGYDPLAFMIEETHKRNIEFHAWINPYRITMNHTDINRLSNNHPARQHPNWVVPYGGKLYYNPGIPEVKKFITEGALEIVQNYDIDAPIWMIIFIHIKWPVKNFQIRKRTKHIITVDLQI